MDERFTQPEQYDEEVQKQQEIKRKKRESALRIKEVLIIVLSLVVAVGLIIQGVFSYTYRIEARNALSDAKNVKRAIELMYSQYYAMDSQLRDYSTPTGITKQAENQLHELLGDVGEFHVTQWNQEGRTVKGLWFEIDKYIVVYEDNNNGSEDSGNWNVYRTSKIMSIK